MSVSIIRKFRGLYDTWGAQTDIERLDNSVSCILPGIDTPIRFEKVEFVSRGQHGLDHFIDNIPKFKMQFDAEPEPNDDSNPSPSGC